MAEGEAWKPKGMNKGDRLLRALEKAHGNRTKEAERQPAKLEQDSASKFTKAKQSKSRSEMVQVPDDNFFRDLMSDERLAGIKTPSEQGISNSTAPASEKTPPQATPRVTGRETTPKTFPPYKYAARQLGSQLLASLEQVRKYRSEGISGRHITKLMSGISASLIRKLAQTPDFTQEMQQLIIEKNLGLGAALVLSKFPPHLQAPIAEACVAGTLRYWRLENVLHHVEYSGKSMKEMLEREGFTWPQGLDDGGTPKQE